MESHYWFLKVFIEAPLAILGTFLTALAAYLAYRQAQESSKAGRSTPAISDSPQDGRGAQKAIVGAIGSFLLAVTTFAFRGCQPPAPIPINPENGVQVSVGPKVEPLPPAAVVTKSKEKATAVPPVKEPIKNPVLPEKEKEVPTPKVDFVPPVRPKKIEIPNTAKAGPFFGRMWTDADGEEIGEAELVKAEGGLLYLRKREGRILEVPIDELASSNKRYVKTGVLLAEDFLGYAIGDVTKWGRNVWVTKGSDGRNWLITSVEGQHTVGVDLPFPQNFYVEFHFYIDTRWEASFESDISHCKSDICFLDDAGVCSRIRWTSKCSPEKNAIDHTFELSDRAKNTVSTNATIARSKFFGGESFGIGFGVIRIEKRQDTIKVLINNRVGVAGSISNVKRCIHFDVDLYKGTKRSRLTDNGVMTGTLNQLTSFRMGNLEKYDSNIIQDPTDVSQALEPGLQISDVITLIGTSPDEKLRAAAWKLLRQQLAGTTQADLPTLRRGMGINSDREIRIACIDAIRAIKEESKEALPDLVVLFSAPDKKLAIRAILAVGSMGKSGANAIPTLEKAAERLEGPVALAAFQALCKIDPGNTSLRTKGIDTLVKSLKPDVNDLEFILARPLGSRSAVALLSVGEPAVAALSKELLIGNNPKSLENRQIAPTAGRLIAYEFLKEFASSARSENDKKFIATLKKQELTLKTFTAQEASLAKQAKISNISQEARQLYAATAEAAFQAHKSIASLP